MNTRLQTEVVISLLFILLLILFLNPFMLWMPETLQYVMIGALAVLFALFVQALRGEEDSDERERAHYRTAGRAGYLLGMAGLLVGIGVQAAQTAHVDPWLVVALILMAGGRLISFVREQKVH